MEFIETLLLILFFIILVYLVGWLPNAWSNEIIHYTNIEDILLRGIRIIIFTALICLAIIAVYGFLYISSCLFI